jgi:multidrug resistance protein
MNKNIAILSLIMVVNALSYGTIIPLLYPYAARFGLSATGLGLLFASFSAAQFLATPIIGRLSDRFGRKPLLLLCLLGTSGSLALFATASSAPMLFVARILDGITGGNISVAQAAIADSTKPADRAKAFGMLGASFGFGFTFGPAMGGILSRFGLSAPFWFASSLALVGTVLGVFLLKETNFKREVKSGVQLFDIKGLVQALFEPVTGPLFLVAFLSLIALNAFILGFQSYTVDVLKLSASQTGVLFALFGVANMLMQGFGIRILVQRIPHKMRIIVGGLVLSSLFMFASALQLPYYAFVIVMMLFALVNSPLSPILSSELSSRAKAEDQGGIMGFNQAYASLAQIIGPLAAGAIIARSMSGVFLIAGVTFLVSLIPLRFVSSSTKVDL